MQNHTFICTVIVSSNAHNISDAQMEVRRSLNKLFEDVMNDPKEREGRKGITDVHGIAVNRMESS